MDRNITIQKACDIIGVPVPENLKHIKDAKCSGAATKMEYAEKDGLFFRIIKCTKDDEPTEKWFKSLKKRGVTAIFMDEEQYYAHGIDKTNHPVIAVNDIIESCGKFFSYIKDQNDVKTIAVTGTCGKTTTMKFLGSIVPDHFNTYMNNGNSNAYTALPKHIFNLTPDNEIYLQETGANSPESIRKSASMLRVNAFIFLNVFKHHINEYKTQENILKDKAQLDEYMKDGGVVVANYDDDLIAGYQFKHRVISFGINTVRDVDYRAENIVQNGSFLELDVVYEGNRVPLRIEILGKQNAYNAIAAFAMCKWLGLDDKQIVKGFEKYESLGFRQNYRQLGGYDLLLDSYNICENSLRADLETMRELPRKEGSKKIAVITGENKLSENAETISYAMGKDLDLSEIDNVICVGVAEETPENLNYYCHTRAVYEGIKDAGYKNVKYVTSPKALEEALKETISLGDCILFKGMYNMDLNPVVDNVFGTALALNNPYYTKRGTFVENEDYKGIKVKIVEGIDITEVKRQYRDVKIPDNIENYPIHRIAPNLFKDSRRIKTLDLGNTLINIGTMAFARCTGLKKVTIPSNVKVIESKAFHSCIALKELIIEDGVTHIGKEAFKNCVSLRKVVIPDSVKYIAEDAFDNCPFIKRS